MSGDSSRIATNPGHAPEPRDLARCQLDCTPFLDFADAEPVLVNHLVERVSGGGFGFLEGAASRRQGSADLDGELFELGFAFAPQPDAFGVGLLDRLSRDDLVGVAGHQMLRSCSTLLSLDPRPASRPRGRHRRPGLLRSTRTNSRGNATFKT